MHMILNYFNSHLVYSVSVSDSNSQPCQTKRIIKYQILWLLTQAKFPLEVTAVLPE